MLKEIKIYRRIKATPEEVYLALVNPFTIELWTGEPAEMSETPETDFSMLNGEIAGRNLEFVPNERILQIWYFGPDHESRVDIRLFPDKSGTQIRILHSGIPEEAYENMLEGWNSSYLDPLTDFFEQ